MTKLKDFNNKRNKGNALISKANYIGFNRFLNLDTNAYKNGTIPEKYKEMIGLASSMVLRCNDCIAYHIEQCYNLGASKEELIEAMNIALIIGGSIVIPHLRYGLEIVEELFNN